VVIDVFDSMFLLGWDAAAVVLASLMVCSVLTISNDLSFKLNHDMLMLGFVECVINHPPLSENGLCFGKPSGIQNLILQTRTKEVSNR